MRPQAAGRPAAPWLAAAAFWAACSGLGTDFLGGHAARPARGVLPRGAFTERRAAPPVCEAPTQPPMATEWRLGVGRAIDVLRADVTKLFSSGRPHTPDLSIFSDDVEIVDARLPSFQVRGLATYQRILSTMDWSVRTTCEQSLMEITSVSPPVNNEVYMRWRLHLWFKSASLLGIGGAPLTVEGYSRYEFQPWTAEIVKHTIDITNPPTYIADLIRQYAQIPNWMMPVPMGAGVPSLMAEALGEAGPVLQASFAAAPAVAA